MRYSVSGYGIVKVHLSLCKKTMTHHTAPNHIATLRKFLKERTRFI